MADGKLVAKLTATAVSAIVAVGAVKAEAPVQALMAGYGSLKSVEHIENGKSGAEK